MKLSDALEEASTGLIFGKQQYWDGKAYCSIGALARSLGYADTELARDRINWYAFTREMEQKGVVVDRDEICLLLGDIIEYNDNEATSFADVVAWLREKGN